MTTIVDSVDDMTADWLTDTPVRFIPAVAGWTGTFEET
jgi:hypothetical protein